MIGTIPEDLLRLLGTFFNSNLLSGFVGAALGVGGTAIIWRRDSRNKSLCYIIAEWSRITSLREAWIVDGAANATYRLEWGKLLPTQPPEKTTDARPENPHSNQATNYE